MKQPRDILDTIANFRNEFRRLGLEAPVSITLKTHEDGERLLCELTQENMLMYVAGDQRYGKPVEFPDGSVWMEIEIVGMKVRWPANRYATRAGDFVWY